MAAAGGSTATAGVKGAEVVTAGAVSPGGETERETAATVRCGLENEEDSPLFFPGWGSSVFVLQLEDASFDNRKGFLFIFVRIRTQKAARQQP